MKRETDLYYPMIEVMREYLSDNLRESERGFSAETHNSKNTLLVKESLLIVIYAPPPSPTPFFFQNSITLCSFKQHSLVDRRPSVCFNYHFILKSINSVTKPNLDYFLIVCAI